MADMIKKLRKMGNPSGDADTDFGNAVADEIESMQGELVEFWELDIISNGSNKNGIYHSCCRNSVVYAMDRLVKLGLFEITKKDGRNVWGRFVT